MLYQKLIQLERGSSTVGGYATDKTARRQFDDEKKKIPEKKRNDRHKIMMILIKSERDSFQLISQHNVTLTDLGVETN